MLTSGGNFFLLIAIGATSAFGCDSPSTVSGEVGSGGVTGVGGRSTLGGAGTSGGSGQAGELSTGGVQSSSDQEPDASANGPCVDQGPLDSLWTPVHGTIRGPRVDGVLCENGVGTDFSGPAAATGGYQLALRTTMGFMAPRPGDFSFSAPTNLAYAVIDGYVGASAAAIGVYTSADACGWLRLELTFPIPPNLACPKPMSPCDPGCSPTNGEMALCEPAHPVWRYHALPSFKCVLGETAVGEWQLSLTAVSPNPSPSGLDDNLTHGRLTATLINDADASDSVQLDLEF